MDIHTDGRGIESSTAIAQDTPPSLRHRVGAKARIFIRRVALLLSLLGAGVKPAHADETIRVLLSDAPGAPTPAQVMSWINTVPRVTSAPLAALQTNPPLVAYWLIPDRAAGDFLAWLNANPHSVRKKLEDYQLFAFAPSDIPAALAALQADPYVLEASLTPHYELATDETDAAPPWIDRPSAEDDQYGWFDLNLDAAWRLAGGYALVGQIDMGLATDHPALRQFAGDAYVGGNFVRVASRDVGLTGQPWQPGFNSADVDEKKLMFIPAGSCTPVDASLPPAVLGHGTHVAGLLGANGASELGVLGACKNCGIAMWKVAFLECNPQKTPPEVEPSLNSNAANGGKAQAIDAGAQVISMSYGNSYDGLNWCQSHRLYPECLSISYAVSRDMPMIAASGNRRTEINFPASDKRVISAGGFQQDLALWDDSPGSAVNCPAAFPAECGSNYSKLHSGFYLTHQELLGSAKRVLSTTYPNTTWVDYAECGDGYGTPMGDGLGWCTGTSMSAPQIAGVVGLLRSINPLVPTGEPEPAMGVKPGLRTVLAQSASRMQIGLTWDPGVGYGIPDAAAAARRMLGKVVGVPARNRATPLFRLYDAVTRDFAETVSPQYALSLMITQVHNYVFPAAGLGAAVPVPGYAFPYDANDPNEPDVNVDPYESAPATARAPVYVLATEYRPRTEWPPLIPLFLMDREYASGRDYMLATSPAEIETAYNGGAIGASYSLRTIQGYIYQRCTPEPQCIPPGAQPLWREYKVADNDCAVFLESEKSVFEANGYTAACPAGANKLLGYAYSSADTDGDGLPDGFEYAVGTNPDAADSDGDGMSDAVEFPLSGVAVSDPCLGGSMGARDCGADEIFKDRFELP